VRARAVFFLAAAATVLASSAALAQVSMAYQAALLARPLSAADQSYCDGKTSSQDDRDACHVTRLVLADIAAHQDKGYPPLATIIYTMSGAERSQIMDLMTKNGG
jgi:hypothetical protein